MSQSPDDREAILARVATILEGLEGVGHFARNDLNIPEGKAPVVLLLDGDERADESAGASGRAGSSVCVVTLMPEVYVVIDEDPSTVGPALSAWRQLITKAILTDAPLKALSKDGEIRYEGMQTGLAMGRSMAGEAGLEFSIRYVFNPAKVTP